MYATSNIPDFTGSRDSRASKSNMKIMNKRKAKMEKASETSTKRQREESKTNQREHKLLCVDVKEEQQQQCRTTRRYIKLRRKLCLWALASFCFHI